MKHKILLFEGILLAAALVAIFILYPRADVQVSGNAVKFEPKNANTIILSINPDFSNPRYIDIEKTNAFDLVAGKYYWKASNDYISGISHEFEIKSEVGMKVTRDENGSELVNIGNVKLNVTKNNEGVMVGYIILEPDSSEKIENEGNYAGGQA